MRSEIIHIECSKIKDWKSFHQYFKDTLGFPDFYGENMDAWIDCMTNLDTEFSTTRIEPGQTITLHLQNVKSLKVKCPDIYDALIECTAFVNWRRLDRGDPPILIISFHE